MRMRYRPGHEINQIFCSFYVIKPKSGSDNIDGWIITSEALRSRFYLSTQNIILWLKTQKSVLVKHIIPLAEIVSKSLHFKDI